MVGPQWMMVSNTMDDGFESPIQGRLLTKHEWKVEVCPASASLLASRRLLRITLCMTDLTVLLQTLIVVYSNSC